MANWWDYGIVGKDNSFLTASDGLVYPIPNTGTSFPDITGPSIIGSIVLNESGSYVPLFTSHTGTQVMVRVTSTLSTNVPAYRPSGTVNVRNFNIALELRKDGNPVQLGSNGTFHVIAGDNNIYSYFYRVASGIPGIYRSNQNAIQWQNCFPRGKSSAGATLQIAMVCTNSGITFYALGFSCYIQPSGDNPTAYHFNAPASYVGRITTNFLENEDYFDPTQDGYRPDDDDNNPTGGTRPVDKNYPGTDVDFPELPTGASALGFSKMQLYNPSGTQLADALDILWNDPETEGTLEKIVESCKKWWYKPEQYCVSLMISPVHPSCPTSKVIKFGKYDTEVSAPVIGNQFQIVDCGTLNVPLKHGSYLDFTKTQAMLFLPYIGFRSINIQEFLGGSIAIKYYVDMYTGSAVCFIKCRNEGCNNSVLYSYECNVNMQIPITSENYANAIQSFQRAATSFGTAALNGVTGNISGLVAAGNDYKESMRAGIKEIAAPPIQTSGSLTPNTGILGNEKPYICLHFPVSLEATNYTSVKGKPSNAVTSLAFLNGFNTFEEVHLDGIDLPEEVMNEIDVALRQGVIL